MVRRPKRGGHNLAHGFFIGGGVANVDWTDPRYKRFVGIHSGLSIVGQEFRITDAIAQKSKT